jgi:hypothetical protein
MAQFTLKAGASIDVLTKPELDDSLKASWEAEMAARGRGMKYLEAAQAANANMVTGFVIPATPQSGYLWALRTVGFISSAGVVAFISKTADPAGVAPYPKPFGRDTSSTIHAFQFSGVQFLLRAGEFAAISSTAAANCTNWNLAYCEVPEELAWKLM